MPWIFIAFGALPVVIGALMCASAVRSLRGDRAAIAGRQKTRAQVVRSGGSSDDNAKKAFVVVRFEIDDGEEMEVTVDVPTGHGLSDGEHLEVYFDPKDPKQVTIPRTGQFTLLFIGVAFLVFGVMLLVGVRSLGKVLQAP